MSLESMQGQLGTIAVRLSECWSTDEVRLSLDQEGVRIEVESRLPFQGELENSLGWITGNARGSDLGTRHYLSVLFGTHRFTRLCNRALGAIPDHFSRYDIERLFIHSADIREEDLKELFEKITHTAAPILFLSGEDARTLRGRFEGVEKFEALDDEQINDLMSLLCPFKTVENVFLQNVPTSDFFLDSGKTFQGLKTRIYIQEKLRREPCVKSMWHQILAKKISNLEIPVGVVMRNYKGGYHKVFATVFGGGAFKTLFCPVAGSRDRTRYILYRGTQALPLATEGAQTILDDLRKEIGSKGVEKTRLVTERFLNDPEQGFVSSLQDTIAGIGMSLGGAHLMRDALLHPLRKIVTVSSPGIDRETCEKYAAIDRPHPVSITHYVEADDVVDQFGRAKLGAGIDRQKGKVRVHILCPNVPGPTLEHVQELRRFPEDDPGFAVLGSFRFLQSLKNSHNRITYSLPEHGVLSFSNDDAAGGEMLPQILLHEGPLYDKRFENIRQLVGLQ